MRILVALIFSLFLFACEKKELAIPKHVEPVVPPQPSSTEGPPLMNQADMASDYRYQIWFSLGENKIVYKNLKTDWDICFQASANGSLVMLNGSRAMRIYKTQFASLLQVTDTAGLAVNGKADQPSGHPDSTAIGAWQTDNKVYIINRGYTEAGQHTGYYKIKFTGVTPSGYTFEYGDVFGQTVFQGVIQKSGEYNFIGYSFTAHAQTNNIEPKKMDYDLCFTNYTHLFHDPFQYYQVTGVLSNNYKTRVAKVNDIVYSNITIKDTLGRTFTTNRDAIGYDWKSFDLNTNLYTIYPKMCYIISDSKGFYYKLHFIDFYNPSGVKGAPKFEFRRL